MLRTGRHRHRHREFTENMDRLDGKRRLPHGSTPSSKHVIRLAREVNSVDQPCSAASTVPQGVPSVPPPGVGFKLPRSPRAHGRPSPRAGDLTAAADTSVDLDTEDAISLNCPVMGKT
jgi:hypothetical protein